MAGVGSTYDDSSHVGNEGTRRTGLGVFIINSSINTTIYIKAMLTGSTLVLRLSPYLAFKARYDILVGYNQLLVNFFNGSNHDNPPQWEVKPFTQRFINHTSSNNARIFKV
jgi:hypothetical protein